MDASFEQLGPYLIIAVSGRLDTVCAPQFDAKLAPVLAGPHQHILVDLSGVSYVSSAGLRSILQLVKHTGESGGRLGLFSVPVPVMDVLEISGFQSRLDLYPDRASALDRKSS